MFYSMKAIWSLYSLTMILDDKNSRVYTKTCLPKINQIQQLAINFFSYNFFCTIQLNIAFNIISISKRISCLKYTRIYVPSLIQALWKRSKYLAQIDVAIFFVILTVTVWITTLFCEVPLILLRREKTRRVYKLEYIGKARKLLISG